MKITKALVRDFEKTQRDHGTEAAIYNIYWSIAASIFHAAGIGDIKTRMKRLKV